jgi:hypothetical protein
MRKPQIRFHNNTCRATGKISHPTSEEAQRHATAITRGDGGRW